MTATQFRNSRNESRNGCAIDDHLTTISSFAHSSAQRMVMLHWRCVDRCILARMPREERNSSNRAENPAAAAQYLSTETEFSLIAP
jgi:hypothetical protein